MKRHRALVITAFLLLPMSLLNAQTILQSKRALLNSQHDLRASSTATVRATTQDDACVFCHTPHNATPGPELWNQQMGTTQFSTYSSSTMQATAGQMSAIDSSKLCLSCHDGTIALGDTVNDGQIAFQQGANYQIPSTSPDNVAGFGGNGFSDDHPFAFAPNLGNTEVRMPQTGDAVALENGKVQCVSCHDPHSERIDTTVGKFLVKNNQGSALCVTCHAKAGWTNSAHQQVVDPQEDQLYTANQGAHTGYVGVANNGCESCHRPHSPGVGTRLVKYPEEQTCLKCHDGSVTKLRVADDFAKTYHHPVEITPSTHDAAESPTNPDSSHLLPETSAAVARHSECMDCHNSHMAQPTPTSYIPQPPAVKPPNMGAKAQSSSNGYLPQAANEYEICFKCHGDSANRPQLLGQGKFGRQPMRQYNANNPNAYNQRIEFTQLNSFHPVTKPRTVTDMSLRTSMTNMSGGALIGRTLNGSSMIYCSDCHASDTNRDLGNGSAGARGPHGSSIAHLLERQSQLETPPAIPGDPTGGPAYSVNNFALCDKCHDVQNAIYSSTTSSFPKHKEHLDAGAACSTCHDPHASQASRLINFDLSIVGPSSAGAVSYTQTTPGHGSCTLKCHGVDHNANSY